MNTETKMLSEEEGFACIRYVVLVASAEENRSTIGLFAYTKTNLSVVVE